jgi:hypothetical protein
MERPSFVCHLSYLLMSTVFVYICGCLMMFFMLAVIYFFGVFAQDMYCGLLTPDKVEATNDDDSSFW